jgi:hypothetical protein
MTTSLDSMLSGADAHAPEHATAPGATPDGRGSLVASRWLIKAGSQGSP